MVELTQNDDIIQMRKTKTRKEIPRGYWIGCQTCRKGFKVGEHKVDWRLRVPFHKGSWNRATMFWTRQCLGCFGFTAKAWELHLPKMINLAQT